MDRSIHLLALVEGSITRVTCGQRGDDSVVARAIAHHLRAGGGRIRARICLHASQQLGLLDDTAVLLGAACELIHNASLVQDDVFDRETSRRGVASVWRLFGETVAVCAGDLMLSAAFAILTELPDATLIAPSIQLAFRLTKSVIVSQGTEKNAMPVTLAAYEAVAINKSASLLTLPLHLPLMVGGHCSSMALAQRVTESFAVAYQIIDDLEDYSQDQQVGALNVLSVLRDSDALDLNHARALAAERAVELLQQSIEQAIELPRDCSAVLVSHARKMLKDIEANSRNFSAKTGNLQYVG